MNRTHRMFARTIGIDYSGAETAESSLKGLRVYQTVGEDEPKEVLPPPGPKKYWTRKGLADWLIYTLDGNGPTIVGIDHAFSFPMRYFERHGIVSDWTAFLDDFCRHWPTDQPNTYVDFVRYGDVGNGRARMGERNWRRLTEEATGSAKSVFHFDVQGSVAKSTHSGIPWLKHIRAAHPKLHFWPFDGWTPASGSSMIAEAYPRLWSAAYPTDDRTPDQHDAYSIARWLQETDQLGEIIEMLAAPKPESIAKTALVEGWIMGAEWAPRKPPFTRRLRKTASKPKTTQLGYVNRNLQEVVERTDLKGNDHNQVVYVLNCQYCGHRYGSNGSDIFQRRCPACDTGRPGLAVD